MQSKLNFITVFVLLFLQTLAQLKAATTRRNSEVLWFGQELQTTPNSVQQDSKHVDTALKNITEKLNHILDEMQNLIDFMLSDDANVYNDSGYQQDSADTDNAKMEQRRKVARQYYLDKYKYLIWNATSPAHPNQTVPPDPVNELIDKVEERHTLPEFLFRPKMISVYPICASNDTMEDNRAPSNRIDLSFDLDSTKPLRGVIINVTSAILKMYKRRVREDLEQLLPNKNVTFAAIYFRSPHHNKKDYSNRKGIKLGDQTFRVGEERWTEWDIKKAISAWYNNTSRNNGVTIKVADDQIRLPAREFFNIPINCSLITDWPDLPPEWRRKSPYDGISEQIPFLDLTIREVPKMEVEFTEKERELVSLASEAKLLQQKGNTGYETTSSSEEHKFRHHKNKETK